MMYLYGIEVIASPYIDDQPRFELGEGVRQYLTREYLDSFDRWSRGFFGTKPTLYQVQGPVGPVIICSSAGYDFLRRVAPHATIRS